MLDLLYGAELREPAMQRAVREVLSLLSGDWAWHVDAGLRPSQDAREPRRLARTLEDALESGRLRLTLRPDEQFAPRRADPLPDFPPPRPAREPTDTFFEVKFIDEVGQAISGVDVELAVNGELQSLRTNPAGIALSEQVEATGASATVAVPDPAPLETLLDQRWVKPRSGTRRKEGNTTELVFTGAPIAAIGLKAAVPNTVVLTPPLGELAVELFDKTGRVRHVDREYRISGPQEFSGRTDEQGRLRHEQVFPGNYALSLTLEFERVDAKEVDTYESPLVVLQPGSSGEVRLLGAVPFSVLARLKFFFNTSKAFLLPTALASFRTLRALYAKNNPSELLVVGHADTAGSTALNDALSLERAQSIIAFLKDDVDAWLAFYETSLPKPRRWGAVEDRLMLLSLPDFTSKPKGESAVRWFQRTRGLTLDGVAGPQTRRQLITEYMALDGASLSEAGITINATAHGCGEHFPLDASGKALDTAPADEQRDPVDRRAELFFFDPEFGIFPAPPGENSAAGSEHYPAWRESAIEEHELSAADAANKLQVLEFEDVLFDTNSAVPLPVPSDGNARSSAIQDAAAALRHAYADANRLVLVAGHTDTTADPAVNDPLSEKRAIAVLALLVGDRDTFRTTCDAQHVERDQQRILEWASARFGFGCDPKFFGGNKDQAVRAFQRAYNDSGRGDNPEAAALTVDGDFGPLTWGAVFDLYELELAELLKGDRELLGEYRKELRFVDDEKRSIGYGERYPIDELGRDGFRSAANRRVEVLFFHEAAQPDLDAPLDASDIYLPGLFGREHLPVEASLDIAPLKAARLPTRFSNGRTFPKPSCLPLLTQVARLSAERPVRIVIVGHTDHSIPDQTNADLALSRAKAVAALLSHDKQFFLQRFEQADPLKRWNWEEVQWMLSAIRVGAERFYVGLVDDYPGDLTRRALGSFQLHSGTLEVDYGCGQETLELLIERYFALLGAPPVPPELITTVAGGSWHAPRKFSAGAVLEELDGELSSVNRRVDVFVFDQPVTPVADTIIPETRTESPTYVRWCLRAEVELKDEPVAFPIRLFDAKLVPIGAVSVKVERTIAETGGFEPVTTLTASPLGSAEFTELPGSYRLSFNARGRQHSFALSLHPDEVGGFAAIIPHSLA